MTGAPLMEVLEPESRELTPHDLAIAAVRDHMEQTCGDFWRYRVMPDRSLHVRPAERKPDLGPAATGLIPASNVWSGRFVDRPFLDCCITSYENELRLLLRPARISAVRLPVVMMLDKVFSAPKSLLNLIKNQWMETLTDSLLNGGRAGGRSDPMYHGFWGVAKRQLQYCQYTRRNVVSMTRMLGYIRWRCMHMSNVQRQLDAPACPHLYPMGQDVLWPGNHTAMSP